MKKLTPKQERFVEEYLVDLNITQAAIRAGYSNKTAHQAGYENMKKPEIALAISEAKQKRSEETGIDAQYVLKNAAEYLDMCMGRSAIKKVINSDGVAESHDVYEFNQAGVGKALELLGKHVEIGAFKDRVEHSGKVELSHEEWLRSLK